MKNLRKIDKFYYIFIVVVIVLAFLVILVAQGIFSAIITVFEFENEPIAKIRLDKTLLNEAVKSTEEKEIISLEINENLVSLIEEE